MKKINILFLIISTVFLTACLQERNNPYDPGAEDNLVDGTAYINVLWENGEIQNSVTYPIGTCGVNSTIDTVFTINNSGDACLDLQKIQMTSSDVFFVITSPVTPVKPGGSTSFTVRFKPDEINTAGFTVSFYIYSNDPEYNVFSFTLNGKCQ